MTDTVNEFGLRLEDYVPWGWTNVPAMARYIAIDIDGGIWAYDAPPHSNRTLYQWFPGGRSGWGCRRVGETGTVVDNWEKCIWEWQAEAEKGGRKVRYNYGWKGLNGAGGTNPNGPYNEMYYALPRPNQKWSDWTRHPEPTGSSYGEACGSGRMHFMQRPTMPYAPTDWWLWYARWKEEDERGGDHEKVGAVACQLRRVRPKVLWRMIRLGWLYKAALNNIHLDGADIHGANLAHASLERASLKGAYLSGANLVTAEMAGAYMDDIDARGTTFVGAEMVRVSLKGADLTGANLNGANLADAFIARADMTRVMAKSTSFCGANMKYVRMYRADLEEANLAEVDLTGANLEGANLSGASLFGAHLDKAVLIGADITNTRFDGVTGAFNVYEGKLHHVVGGQLVEHA